jgi:nucleoside-diphosphate-sugar epimerase
MKVLVTGPTGFVGMALVDALRREGVQTVEAVRQQLAKTDVVTVGDIGATTDWTQALATVSHVVHLAARVHVMHETARDPLAEFRAVNLAGTERLAMQAAAAGVKRLIYVSTIKVNGEETPGKPFAEGDPPQPSDPYAVSKWEAEQALQRVAVTTGLELVIVRPPLIYGPGVKGNFLSLMRLVENGWPLPVGRCNNRRSLLGLGNFVSFLSLCVRHPAAAGQTFLVSDGEDLSTPELIRRLAAAMGKPPRLLSVPPSWLRVATRLLGRPGAYQRLCGSLQINSGHARQALDWLPPETVSEGLVRTVEGFFQQRDGQAATRNGRA